MAWWTNILFFNKYGRSLRGAPPEKGEPISLVLKRALQNWLQDRLVDTLYVFLSIFTYAYLVATITVYFFEDSFPPYVPDIIDTLSEPYLGVLGIYVVVKEIERRRGKIPERSRGGELFVTGWFAFLIVATLSAYFSEHYQLNIVYKTVVTNSLAAIIIRIGTLLKIP